MEYAGKSAMSNNTIKQTSVSSAIEDFDPVLERASLCAERLKQLHDRVHGPQPSEARVNGSEGAKSSSIIASLHMRRSKLVEIVDSIERSINSLDSEL